MSDVYADILERLFAKYRHSPNILKVFEILSDPLQDTSDAIDYILDHLSVDEAEGPLLDAIASWIGVDRPAAQEEDIFWLCRDEEVADDPDNHHGLATDALTEGGYLTGDDGCPSKSDPGSYVSDEDFRLFIRAKASTFRKKATREIMYNYILQFAVRSKLIEGTRTVEIEPSSYDDLNYQIRYHLTNLGYKPAGITISIKQQTESDPEV
jgi:hypothetical protein